MGSPVFLIWIVLIGAMFYFMMIRPQKRARQQQVDMLQHLQPGAEVRTTAQIMGTVVEVGDDWAIVETTPGTRIKFGKPAIVGIIMPDEEEAPTPGGIGDAPADETETTKVTDAADAAETHSVRDAVPAEAAEDSADLADKASVEDAKDAEPAAKP
ncbi:MAG: preprotein translocase subunit YajC [Catenulispora sp.]|nr:preprotein translocase subunit YajC [Catenulispora sp.]